MTQPLPITGQASSGPAFTNLAEFAALLKHLPVADPSQKRAAEQRNAQLTKPKEALGRLEDLAIWYAAWQSHISPQSLSPQIVIFAGNHGVARHGISAYPGDVTEQMVRNFTVGGAAINQLAEMARAQLDIFPLDLERPTSDLSVGAAMTETECIAALNAGWNSVRSQAGLLICGEMGIGNTTSAAAICLALYAGRAEDWVGPGTGVHDDGLQRKREVVTAALKANGPFSARDGLAILQTLGGREIAAMAGAMARARMLRIPVMLDGYVCCAAAACLHACAPDIMDHMIAGHLSAEPAHRALLSKLGKTPLLDAGMRLGEGSGAAVAIHILISALACHTGMATFAEAGVSGASVDSLSP